jgi:hypothetical protein
LVQALERAILGEEGVPTEILYAFDIYLDPYQKEVVEAFLIGQATNEEVKDILDIPGEVCDAYRHLFFDAGVFRNRLDLISYVTAYEADDGGFGKTLKLQALKIGLEPLKATFKPGYQVNPLIAVQESMTQSYLLSKSAMDHPIDSQKAREARQWAAMTLSSINAASTAKGLSGGDDRNLLIKLELMMPDIPPGDIVHRAEEDT